MADTQRWPDARAERVRHHLTDPVSREMAESRGIDVEDAEALLAAYDERLRVNVGLLMENADLRKHVAAGEFIAT